MILEIDYGNTRLKWRLISFTQEIMHKGAAQDLREFDSQLKDLVAGKVVFCRACSVRGKVENLCLAELIERHYCIAVQFAQSVKVLAGVTNGYADESQLGVDRWLAVVAAYEQIQGACVVIDCGTAITVDYVADDGRHLGGCIAPGQRLMCNALNLNTQLLVDTKRINHVRGLSLGDNTQDGIAVGINTMMVGFIKEQVRIAEEVVGSSFVVISAGGDGGLVSTVVEGALCDEDLVFSGLAIACPYVQLSF